MMMSQLADTLVAAAKSYRAGFVAAHPMDGRAVDVDLVERVIRPFVMASCERVPTDVKHALQRRFDRWLPASIESVNRNRHMHHWRGEPFGLVALDALLVDFCNNAVAPLDLGLYSEDLS